jgi:uncharacterized protein (DUF2237 family)
MKPALNVLGGPLVPCSFDPLTGWKRDGCCDTDENDAGSHVVCARMSVSFLNFQMELGNDLITPRPEARFRGLAPGDRWCVCALRWRAAAAPSAARFSCACPGPRPGSRRKGASTGLYRSQAPEPGESTCLRSCGDLPVRAQG